MSHRASAGTISILQKGSLTATTQKPTTPFNPLPSDHASGYDSDEEQSRLHERGYYRRAPVAVDNEFPVESIQRQQPGGTVRDLLPFMLTLSDNSN